MNTQSSTQEDHASVAVAVLDRLVRHHGWTGRGEGYVSVTKLFPTAVGMKQAVIYVRDGKQEKDCYLTADYQSEGGNALSTCTGSIGPRSSLEDVNVRVDTFVAEVTAKVARTYAAKLRAMGPKPTGILTPSINLDDEAQHIAEFLSLKWSPIRPLIGLIKEIRDAALHAGRGLFDPHEAWDHADKLLTARASMLQEHLALDQDIGVDYYDALCTLLDSYASATRDLADAGRTLDGPWNYEARVGRLLEDLAPRYAGLQYARPLGWCDLEQGYVDFAGQEEYDPRPDQELFQGVKIEGLLSPGFTSLVALPYVMYDEKCQGRKAPNVLVGAVFAHFLKIAEFLNTHKLKTDLEAALPQLRDPCMLFERKVDTSNPFLKVAFEMARPCPTRAEYHQHIARQAAFRALPIEEQDAQRQANIERVLQEIDEWKLDSPQEAENLCTLQQRRRDMLLAAFETTPAEPAPRPRRPNGP